jgi:hypothetical protein
VCGAPDAFNSTSIDVGEDVRIITLGIFDGVFVGGTIVGASVSIMSESFESFENGPLSQGVLGKQARPSGHSADEPVGQGLVQDVDASGKSTPQ